MEGYGHVNDLSQHPPVQTGLAQRRGAKSASKRKVAMNIYAVPMPKWMIALI
jgi:hypothetical protein